MKKRIFNWNHLKNKKYVDRECPNFDFIEGCVNGTVVWWNENQLCVDMDKLNSNLGVKENERRRRNNGIF